MSYKEIQPNDFNQENHFYPKALNSQIHLMVAHLIQKKKIRSSIFGVDNILADLGMILEPIDHEDINDGVVVGKNVNPVCQVGTRVFHLGKIWQDYELKV